MLSQVTSSNNCASAALASFSAISYKGTFSAVFTAVSRHVFAVYAKIWYVYAHMNVFFFMSVLHKGKGGHDGIFRVQEALVTSSHSLV